MFTPKELQEKTFDKAVFGGYDMQTVDEFLEPLTEDYITLYKENSVLKSKMKILVEKLEEYREQELSMKKALVAAQQTADTIIAEAQKKASKILNDAEYAAQNRASTVKEEFAEEEARVERARTAAQSFIDAIETDVRQHLEVLERLKRVAPAAAPVAEPKPQPEPQPEPEPEPESDPDSEFAIEIGAVVQEISGEKSEPADFRFDSFSFGK